MDLYEMSSTRLKLDHTLRGLLGVRPGFAREAGLFRPQDRIGRLDESRPALRKDQHPDWHDGARPRAGQILGAFKVDALTGAYRVQLRPNGSGQRWTAFDADTHQELDIDPGTRTSTSTSMLQRLRLMLPAWFITESRL